MATLSESLDNESEAWKPEPGDKLVGIVTNIEIVDSKFGGKYPVVEVSTDDTVRVFHAFHTVAKNQLRRAKPQVGEPIAIKFLGDHVNGYKDYRIRVERPGAVAWEELSTPPDDEPPDDYGD
jgi:hypothetical protein